MAYFSNLCGVAPIEPIRDMFLLDIYSHTYSSLSTRGARHVFSPGQRTGRHPRLHTRVYGSTPLNLIFPPIWVDEHGCPGRYWIDRVSPGPKAILYIHSGAVIEASMISEEFCTSASTTGQCNLRRFCGSFSCTWESIHHRSLNGFIPPFPHVQN